MLAQRCCVELPQGALVERSLHTLALALEDLSETFRLEYCIMCSEGVREAESESESIRLQYRVAVGWTVKAQDTLQGSLKERAFNLNLEALRQQSFDKSIQKVRPLYLREAAYRATKLKKNPKNEDGLSTTSNSLRDCPVSQLVMLLSLEAEFWTKANSALSFKPGLLASILVVHFGCWCNCAIALEKSQNPKKTQTKKSS